MTYDPEIPAGLQDADLEEAELEQVGDQLAHLQRQGVCTHNWVAGPANPSHGAGLTGEQLRCIEQHDRPDGCRQVFADEDAWHAAMEEVLA